MKHWVALIVVAVLGAGAASAARPEPTLHVALEPTPSASTVAHYEVRTGDLSFAAVARHIAADVLCPELTQDQADTFGNRVWEANGRPAVIRVGLVLHYDLEDVPCTDPTPPSTTPTSSSTQPATTSTTSPPPPTSTTTTTVTPPSTTLPSTTAPPTTVPSASAFVEDFSSAAGFYDRFVTHVGNACTADQSCRPEDIGDSIKAFPGSHNLACEPPPTTRTVSIVNHANLFWHCAPGGPSTGHVMTGLSTSGYAIVSFSPDQTFTDVERVCWSQSLADLGGGIWNNVVLVPEPTYLSNPNPNPTRMQEGEGPFRLDYVTPGFDDANGPGGFNLIDIDGIFGVKQFRGTLGIYDGHNFIAQWGDEWTAGTDQSTRYRHCFTDNGDGTVTISQQRATGTVIHTTAGSFPDGPVRVVFQDDHYDDLKHGGVPGMKTWHWDDVTIEVTS